MELTLGSDCVVHEVSAKDDDGKTGRVVLDLICIRTNATKRKKTNDQGYDATIFVSGVEELFFQITRKLVERKNEIERNARLKAENAITLQQLEDERLLQSLASHENNSSVCCGI